MKGFVTLVAILAIAVGAQAAEFVSLGPSTDTETIGCQDCRDCTGDLIYYHNDTFENGYCWQFGGIAPPYGGAFGEGFWLGEGQVVCGAYWLTQLGNYFGQSVDIYIWEGGWDSFPGEVLYLGTGVMDNVPTWPSVGQSNVEIGFEVNDEFTLGYWIDATDGCFFYIGADQDGPGGFPWTYVVADGQPQGWQDPSVVWGATASLGFGVYFSDEPTPVESSTWGAIKQLF